MDRADFLIEKRLRELNPELHKRFSDTVLSLLHLLSKYEEIFPDYTDHSEMHALAVIDFCNTLIGPERIKQMNADELYVLLMGCYFHDVGMGTSEKDLEEFNSQIDMGDFLETHDPKDRAQMVRCFHHEYSGRFLKKYADIFDFPSEEHTFAIIQIARGHRKTDLFDEEEYPESMTMDSGNSVCVPYLAAILRLADEIDVAADRNLAPLYDISAISDPHQIFEFKKHEAVRRVDITDDAFTLIVKTEDEKVYDGILELAGKMRSTLDYCVKVAEKRTPWTITQREVLLRRE